MVEKHDLGFLDGLRAIAALWVMTAHCFIWGAGPAWIIPNPELAVDLFMMLSGLLMMHSVENHRDGKKWRDFYVRRVFRIVPAYYFALAAVVFVPWFLSGYTNLFHLARPSPLAWWHDAENIHISTVTLLTHVSFVFGLIPSQTDATMLPDWSLSLEMQFYLAFPLLHLALKRFGYVPVFVATLVIFISAHLAVKLVGGAYYGSLFPEPSPLPLKLPYFAIGMLMYVCAFDGARSARDRLGILTCCGLLAVSQFHTYGAFALLELFFVATFWLCLSPVASRHRAIATGKRLLGGALAKFGSRASYSVYLFHGFIIALCGEFLFVRPDFLALPVAMRIAVMWITVAAGSYGLATLIYRFIERPGMMLGAKLIADSISSGKPAATKAAE